MSEMDKKQWLNILFEDNKLQYNEALAYVQQNFMQYYPDDFFLQLKLETFSNLLKSDDLNVPNEEVVFVSVQRWLNFNNLNPYSYLSQLLPVVRLPLLPIKYLFEEVEPFVYPIEDCRNEFLSTLKYHLFGESKLNVTVRKYQKISLDENIMNSVTKPSIAPGMKLLSIGSNVLKNANVIEIYDNNQNQWIKPKSLAINKRNFSVAMIDGKVMLIGGTQSPDEDSDPLNTVQSLDLMTGIISMEASLNDNRQYSASVVLGKGKNSFLYVLGGRGKEGVLNSVERWNPLTRVWTRAQSMLNKREGFAAVIFDDKIYVIGGKFNSVYLNTMEAYNFDDEEWEQKASMNETRAYFCATVFKGFLYCVAGSNDHNLYSNTFEKYNPHDDTWMILANITMTGNVGISSLGKKLICAGGKDSKNVFEYDEINDKWIKLSDLHLPREGYLIELPKKMKEFKFDWNVGTILSHKLLSIGSREPDTSGVLEVYDAKENQWSRLSDINIDKINYSVAYVNEQVLLIGGVTADKIYQLNSVDSLNLRTGKILQIAPLNVRRQHSSAIVLKLEKVNFVFVLGGLENGKLLRSVERWDTLSGTWVFMTPMTFARTGHGTVLLQDNIYLIGGKVGNTYSKTVEAYDFENDRWIAKSSMNNKNAYFGVTTFKNHIYVAGGNADPGTPINIVERYDPIQNIWITIANILSTGAVGISGLGNKLICAGGRSSNVVEEYDEKNNQWRELTRMNVKRAGFLIELQSDVENAWFDWNIEKPSVNSKLVHLGSWTLQTGNNVEIFDTKENRWTKLKDIPINRRSYSVNIIDNQLLIIGGNDDKLSLNTVNAIDLTTGTMKSLLPLKEVRAYPSTVVVQEGSKNILYVLGGWGNNGLIASVEKWDPSTNEWTYGVPMTTTRVGHGVVFLHGKIYAIGGRIESPYLNTVESFDIKSEIWEQKAPMKNTNAYFGISTFKDYIYVVGGAVQYGSPTSVVERYDPFKNSWLTLANIISSEGVGLCSIGNRLISAGGTKNTVQEYDELQNKWVTLPSMNVTRCGFLLELPKNAKL